jgi:hypothetical protein
MQLKDLAKELDISPSMVSQLKKRGMPVNSVEAAERWRRRHLTFARTKGTRAGTERPAPAERAIGETVSGGRVSDTLVDRATAAALARVRALGLLGKDALVGDTFGVLKPMLQHAMAAVPPAAREHVQLPLEVWDALTACIPAGGGSEASDGVELSEDFMATFWYQVALGPELSDHRIVSATPLAESRAKRHAGGDGG